MSRLGRCFLLVTGLLAAPAWADVPRVDVPIADSMSLADAYRAALQVAEQVQSAEVNLDTARSRYKQALTQMGPQISLLSSGTVGNPAGVPVNATTGPMTVPIQRLAVVSVGAQISQPLFRYELFASRDAGRIGVEASEKAILRVREQLMMDVTASFIAVLRTRQQIQLAESAVTRAEAQVNWAKTRVKAGASLKTAELLATVEFSRARLALVSAQAEARSQEATFELLTGRPAPRALVLPSTPAAPELLEAIDHGGSRSDARVLQLQLDQALATERSLKARIFWPTLDLVGSVTYNAYMNPSGPAYVANGRLALTVPLFQGGSEFSLVTQARLRGQIAKLQLSLLRRQISDDVRRAAIRLDAARKSVEVIEHQHEAAAQNYALVASQFRLGAATFLEVAIAQGALTDAENLKVVISYEQQLATYQLLFVSGGLRL